MVVTISSEPKLTCRSIQPADEDVLFAWRNDPWIVQQGVSQRTVTRDEHHRWFNAALVGSEREIYLVEIDGRPAGMVRYDFDAADEAEVSIYLLPPNPGRGYGHDVMLSTAPDIFMRRSIERLVARVLPDNERSLRFFRRLGFRELSDSPAGKVTVLTLGRPVIPHSRPWIAEDDVSAVCAVVASRQLAQGPLVLELERRWAQASGMVASAAVSSGLSALRLALLVLGIGEGDEVIVPGYSCVALPNAVSSLGAEPVLADVDLDRWTISVDDVRARLTSRTRAIIAVHLFGFPAPIDQLQEIGLPIVEDCAHGIGGYSGKNQFGSGGTLSMASFYATKMLPAGEGGIVAGTDSALIERVREARDYGDRPSNGKHLNDKMTDMEAALALAQLDRLPETLRRREERAKRYRQWLQPFVEEKLLELPSGAEGRIWYRYPVKLTKHRAASVAEGMAERGVRAEQPVWDLRETAIWNDDLTNTAAGFDYLLSLPLYPDLSELQQRMVCHALRAALESDDTN